MDVRYIFGLQEMMTSKSPKGEFKFQTETLPGYAGQDIDDNDKTARFAAAHYRFSARIRDLELQFEAKASELRAAFVAEVAEIKRHSGGKLD